MPICIPAAWFANQLPDKMPMKTVKDNASASLWASAPDSSLQNGPAPVIAAMWGVYQEMENLSVSPLGINVPFK